MTIKQLASELEIVPITVVRKIRKFNQTNGTSHATGANDQIVDTDLLQYIKSKKKGKKAKPSGSVKQEPKPEQPKPDQPKPLIPEPKPKRSTRKSKANKLTNHLSLVTFLNSKVIELMAVLSVLVADGGSMAIISKRVMNTNFIGLDLIFGLIGFWIGYTAFLVGYKMRATKVYEFDARKFWLFAFATYQVLLHGASTQAFGSGNVLVSQVVIISAIALTAAGISVTTWKTIKK